MNFQVEVKSINEKTNAFQIISSFEISNHSNVKSEHILIAGMCREYEDK